jgi:hypothetical protein
VTDTPSADRAVPGLARRARMLLPVVLPLMVYLLIRLGDSSRTAVAVAGGLLAVVAVGSPLLARRRAAEHPDS